MINYTNADPKEPIIYLIGSNRDAWQDKLVKQLLEMNPNINIQAPLKEKLVNDGTELSKINHPYMDKRHTPQYYLKKALEYGMIVFNFKDFTNVEYIKSYLNLLNILKEINNIEANTCLIYGERKKELIDKVNYIFKEVIIESDLLELCNQIINIYLQKKEIYNNHQKN